jgi:uncharacterized protein (TIGR03435 family)
MRPMLRALLTERLGVRVHREKREMSIYLLTEAKSGTKLKASTSEGPPEFTKGRGALLAYRVTMAEFAAKVSDPLKRPVVDMTGMKERYDIKIDITPYATESGEMDVMSILFTALQQQLGLKLEGRKEMVDVVVVDKAEKTVAEN